MVSLRDQLKTLGLFTGNAQSSLRGHCHLLIGAPNRYDLLGGKRANEDTQALIRDVRRNMTVTRGPNGDVCS